MRMKKGRNIQAAASNLKKWAGLDSNFHQKNFHKCPKTLHLATLRPLSVVFQDIFKMRFFALRYG